MEVASPYLEDLGELLTDEVADVPGEGQDDEDEVVHGPADGEGLGVVVEAVAPGEVDNTDLENRVNKAARRVATLVVILCMAGTSVWANRPVLPCRPHTRLSRLVLPESCTPTRPARV